MDKIIFFKQYVPTNDIDIVFLSSWPKLLPISYEAVHATTPIVHGPHVMFLGLKWEEGLSVWKGICRGHSLDGSLPEWDPLPDPKSVKRPLCELLAPDMPIPDLLDSPNIICTLTEYPSTNKKIVFVPDLQYSLAKQNSAFYRFLSPLLDKHPLLQEFLDLVILVFIFLIIVLVGIINAIRRSKFWTSLRQKLNEKTHRK